MKKFLYFTLILITPRLAIAEEPATLVKCYLLSPKICIYQCKKGYHLIQKLDSTDERIAMCESNLENCETATSDKAQCQKCKENFYISCNSIEGAYCIKKDMRYYGIMAAALLTTLFTTYLLCLIIINFIVKKTGWRVSKRAQENGSEEAGMSTGIERVDTEYIDLNSDKTEGTRNAYEVFRRYSESSEMTKILNLAGSDDYDSTVRLRWKFRTRSSMFKNPTGE